MSLYSRVKTWIDGEVLSAGDLNAEFDNILNNSIPDSIEDASANVAAMQTVVSPGDVGTESLATNLTGELQRIRYMLKSFSGKAQWYVPPDGTIGNYTDGSVSTAKLADGAVTTVKIADGNVTQAKRVALGQQISSFVSNTFVGATFTDAGLSVSITTTGRPVFLSLRAKDATFYDIGSFIGIEDLDTSGGYVEGFIKFVRGSTDVAIHGMQSWADGVSFNEKLRVPPTSFTHIDTPAAGTYTYKIQVRAGTAGDMVSVRDVALIAFEL